jgi:hypothetical protein
VPCMRRSRGGKMIHHVEADWFAAFNYRKKQRMRHPVPAAHSHAGCATQR